MPLRRHVVSSILKAPNDSWARLVKASIRAGDRVAMRESGGGDWFTIYPKHMEWWLAAGAVCQPRRDG